MDLGGHVMSIQKSSAFRQWVEELWRQNCDERLTYSESPATINQYWNNYKWWLKREYRHRQRRTN
jgi:hypothetical protein